MADKHFIFICGLHRSGTSLLHAILRSHPDISGFANTDAVEDEGQHLQTVYPTDNAFGGPGYFGFHPESFMDERHPLATPENAARLFQQWSCYWDLDKDYLLEKSPPNIVRTRFLQKLFPNSSFIIIYRHPIAVAYATRKWSQTTALSLLEHTLRCYERCLNDVHFLNRVYMLHYEELVNNPTQEVHAITDWMGLRRFDIRQEVRTHDNAKYFSMWEKDRRNLLKIVLGEFKGFVLKVGSFERRANIFGYSIRTPEALNDVAFKGSPFARNSI